MTYGKVSFWLWKKPGKLREFFLLLCGHPVIIHTPLPMSLLVYGHADLCSVRVDV